MLTNRKEDRFMIEQRLIALCVAAALLAGCNKQDHNIVGGTPDTQAGELANAAPVSLPPMIVASMTYRCKDNSVVYVEFMNDNKTANLRSTKDGPATALTAPEPGKPYAAEGYALTGAAGAKTVTLARPGKGSQECKA